MAAHWDQWEQHTGAVPWEASGQSFREGGCQAERQLPEGYGLLDLVLSLGQHPENLGRAVGLAAATTGPGLTPERSERPERPENLVSPGSADTRSGCTARWVAKQP